MVIGSVGLDQFTIALSEDEVRAYDRQGKTFITELVQAINDSPSAFQARRIRSTKHASIDTGESNDEITGTKATNPEG